MSGEIHIWHIEARDDFIPPDKQLQRRELDRMRRFRSPLQGRRWACFRSGMRLVLARYLKTSPADIHFRTKKRGKLTIREWPDLHFNLSHSGALGLLAVTTLGPVGVDVEHRRSLPAIEDVIDLCFTSQEREDLLALPAESREDVFYELWTCKEAVMKASGMGLHMSPDSIDVGVDGGRRSTAGWQAVYVPAAARHGGHFRLSRLDVGAGYRGAVALELAASAPFRTPCLRYFDCDPAAPSRPDQPVLPRRAGAEAFMEPAHADPEQ